MFPRSKRGCRVILTLLSCYLALPFSAPCWWETGHETVARIAAAHLTAAARGRIARILDVPDTPEVIADALAKGSIWPDQIAKATQTSKWHYIDLALQDHKSDIPERCPQDNCAPARIQLFAVQLASRPADTRWSELDALRFLVHFVGDIHQPLHGISDADEGGNCERLNPQIGKAKNLHALWDGEIVNAINPDDQLLAVELEKEIDTFGSQREREISGGTPDDWAWESHKLAIKDIYQRLHIPTEPVEFPASCEDAPEEIRELRLHIEASYIDEMKPVVRSQLEKAGLRLARMLNEAL